MNRQVRYQLNEIMAEAIARGKELRRMHARADLTPLWLETILRLSGIVKGIELAYHPELKPAKLKERCSYRPWSYENFVLSVSRRP